MKKQSLNRGATCVGAVRLLPIDMGFDPREQGQAIDISDANDADLSTERAGYSTGVGYLDREGVAHLMHGTREEVGVELSRCGYTVIVAHTPNGREIRCEPSRPGKILCQPPADNYWKEFDSVADALAQF